MNKKLLAGTLTALILCFGIYSLLANYKLDASTKFHSLSNNNTTSPLSTPDNELSSDDVHFDDVHTSTTKPIDRNLTSITLFVNKEYPLSPTYVPSDLVVPNIKFSFNYYDEKKQLRKEAADALEKLFAASEEQGLKLRGVSGYRSFNRQTSIYQSNLKTKGLAHTSKYSAKPGYSEHQTGLAIDVSTPSIGNRLTQRFGRTLEGMWLAQNCYKYGFIIRYPENKEELTGYSYEPWHIRYVGVDVATYLTKQNLTLEEYFGYTPSTDIYEDGVGSYDTDTNDVASLPTVKPTKKPATPTPSLKPEVTETPQVSEKPQETEKPHETEKPQEPENPQETEKPQEPENPQETEKPQESENPQETEKPQEPENPQVSEKPQEPENPQVSEKPQEPETPQEPEKPQAPEDSQVSEHSQESENAQAFE